jgi:hypothetical protein
VSFQITILKVLAGHPGGRVSLAELKHAVAILISSGPDWTDRTKRLAARAPGARYLRSSTCSTRRYRLANHGRRPSAARIGRSADADDGRTSEGSQCTDHADPGIATDKAGWREPAKIASSRS